MENKKFIIFMLIFLAIIMMSSYISSSFTTSQNFAIAEGQTSAKSAIVIEAKTGRVLFEKNKDEKLAMASTTKIMTALIACENTTSFDEIVEVNDSAVGIEGTSMYLRKGEKLTIKELLYGLMLPSGNDAAVALAYHFGGTEEKFVEMMNEKAKALNLKNTHFANPHGLDAKGHYTSAHDLAIITAEALKNETFKEISSTKNITITGSKINEPRFLFNKNKLLKTLEGCNGVKTGFTDNAQRCFVCSCERDGMTLISVVLNCGPMFEESASLMNSAFEKYKMREILPEYSVGEKIKIENGEKDYVQTATKKGFSYPLSDEEYRNINIIRNVPDFLEAPAHKDKEVGEIEIYLNKDLIFKEKIYTMENVKSIKYLDKIWEIVDEWNI